MSKVVVFNFNGHAAILNPAEADIIEAAKSSVPAGVDYWIVDGIDLPEPATDPSAPVVEPTLSDFGVDPEETVPDGVGDGPEIALEVAEAV